MRWFFKAGAFKLLSLMPGGEVVHRSLQKYLTRSIIPTRERILQKFHVGMAYLDFLNGFFEGIPPHLVTHIDIGAGWMPTIPLLFYCAGIDRQVLCDIRRHMDRELVSNVVPIIHEIIEEKGLLGQSRLRRIPPPIGSHEQLDQYFSRLGMRYVAPYSIDNLISEENVKVVTCTMVLLYLNRQEISSLFRMVASALSQGDLFIATVKCYDLYADVDPGISLYNKFKYSEFVWERIINSKLMHFNRLIPQKYCQLLTEAGFDLEYIRITESTSDDLEQLKRIRIDKQFHNIPAHELAAKEFFVVAKVQEQRC